MNLYDFKDQKIFVSLSGGMDSTALLDMTMRSKPLCVKAVSFKYPSKHNPWEIDAAKKITGYYDIEHEIIDVSSLFGGFKSNLLKQGGDIPEGHYNDDSMSKTVVPGRNLIFASVVVGLAESIGFGVVALAVHSGDHHIYPDCRPGFIRYLQNTVKESTEGKVTISAPFLYMDKTSIIQKCPQAAYHLTRTCYKDQYAACGKCGSCRERLEAFENNGMVDPINYE